LLCMGIKRLFLVLLVLLVVVGLLGLLFLQIGADERLVKSFMPKIEQRLGIDISFDHVSTSLTAVSFDNVKISLKGNDKPLMLVNRLGVGFRIGPLLMGHLDLTGLRIDGLKLKLGEATGGAGLNDWRTLAARISNKEDTKKINVADLDKSSGLNIHLVSGDLYFNNGRFKIVLEKLSGRIFESGRTTIDFDDYRIVRDDRSLIFGNHGQLRYTADDKIARLDLDKPVFEISADMAEMSDTYKDIVQTLSEITGANPKRSINKDKDNYTMPLIVSISEGEGVVTGGKENGVEVNMEDIFAEMSLNSNGLSMLRGTGGLPGTDARWTMGFHRSLKDEPTITLEVPDLPLKKVGLLFTNTEHIDWTKSSIDGAITVVLPTKGKKLSIEGQAAISALIVKHEMLGSDPINNLDVHLDFKATYNRNNQSVHLERLLLSRGLSRVTLRGTVHFDHLNLDLTANVPPTACRQIFGAVPSQLRTKLQGVQMEGRLALDLRIALDREKPELTVFEVNLQNDCRVTNWGTVPVPDSFRRPFSYMAYSENNDRIRLVTGPGTDRWTPYSMISPYLIGAVLTTEDGKFRHHNGMTSPEIRRAIELNLKKGAFKHGASTITMQLAKNLFLSRDRTISRKLQELFFTWYLESNYTKDEILELYFNVIEFGPSLYGIKDAAKLYFGRDPHELNQIESVFLIRLLPNPVGRYAAYENGRVSDRRMKSLHKVLEIMLSRKYITLAEYREALEQPLLFYREGAPLPEPRTLTMHAGTGISNLKDSSDNQQEIDMDDHLEIPDH